METKARTRRHHGIHLYWTLELRDKNGVLLSRRIVPCHSYVKFVMLYFQTNFMNASSYTATDTGGTSRTLRCTQGGSGDRPNGSCAAGATDTTYGIVVGTGQTAVSPADTKLGTQIGHGTSSGQLQYGGTSFSSVSTTSTQSKFSVTRGFTNGSGASVTLYEIGVYVNFNDTGQTIRKFCLIRDLQTQTVNNGATLTATLTLAFSC